MEILSITQDAIKFEAVLTIGEKRASVTCRKRNGKLHSVKFVTSYGFGARKCHLITEPLNWRDFKNGLIDFYPRLSEDQWNMLIDEAVQWWY